MSLLHTPHRGGGTCPVCDGESCRPSTSAGWPNKYPFAAGGFDPMEGMQQGVDFVYAPHAIADPDLERNVYGAGDPVPMADAIKYGLVAAPDPAPEPEPPKGRRRAKKGPAEDRAKRLDEDRDGAA